VKKRKNLIGNMKKKKRGKETPEPKFGKRD